jgi:uncharacterized damage-inducible protein DinB
MPAMPLPAADERESLLSFLAQQRYLIRVATHGLTDEQARATPARSALSVGGVVKHVTLVERTWADTIQRRPTRDPERYAASFTMLADESLPALLADNDLAAKETEAVIAGIADLGEPVPVPPGVPWYPQDLTAWSVRWVLLHLIEELSRHAGHADMIREALDGATAFPLLAAVEGWQPTPWLTPWSPGS